MIIDRWVSFPEFECWFCVSLYKGKHCLLWSPMLSDGGIETFNGEISAGDVSDFPPKEMEAGQSIWRSVRA